MTNRASQILKHPPKYQDTVPNTKYSIPNTMTVFWVANYATQNTVRISSYIELSDYIESLYNIAKENIANFTRFCMEKILNRKWCLWRKKDKYQVWWANSVFGTEYEYSFGSEIWPNTNTNTIRVEKFGQIRIQIVFEFWNFSEYEYHFCMKTNINNSIIWIIPNTNTNIKY